MLRKAIAGAALAALMAGCAGLPTMDVSTVNTTGVNTTAQVSTAPAPPLALEHANWSDFGESPAGTFAVSSAVSESQDVAYDSWSDFGESPPVERTSSAMMLEDEHEDWSDFGESPADAVR